MSPAIISVVEKNVDMSILFNISEEENSKTEISKVFDLEIDQQKSAFSIFNSLKEHANIPFYSKEYTPIFLEKSFPPPELV
ncbi:hypothetical protein [uncultured Polaribacter sp.]|uniref:hypothetical protein n=1 Tax=uncultured Polaribacter sp. TaxID=174711 RepID=UPI002605A3BF|nr:hypothetical protein [uncultured Polaribacter sp.]